MSLKKFIAQQNATVDMMRKFGGWSDAQAAAATYPEDVKLLTGAQRTALAQRLSCSLSPENLCCDGELRGAKLQAKARLLHKAKDELEGLTGMAIPAY